MALFEPAGPAPQILPPRSRPPAIRLLATRSLDHCPGRAVTETFRRIRRFNGDCGGAEVLAVFLRVEEGAV